MDFTVFPYIKSFLRGMRFDNLSELRQAVMKVIFHMKTDQFVQIFDDCYSISEQNFVNKNELQV
jgi:predicted nucleic acid-binding OB-fold protein